MQELLIVGGSKKSTAIFDVDVTRQAVGDKFLMDWSGNSPLELVGSGPVVVQDATLGKAMAFMNNAGRGMFQTNGPVDLSSQPLIIEVIFRTVSSNARQVVWATGDYPSSFTAGVAHYAYVNVGSHQLFSVDALGNFTRSSILGPAAQDFHLVITTDPVAKTFTVKNVRSGQTQVLSVPYWFGPGARLSLGGSYVGGLDYAPLQGYIQKLKISIPG